MRIFVLTPNTFTGDALVPGEEYEVKPHNEGTEKQNRAWHALLFYRDKLPKFINRGRMVFNCIPMIRDTETPIIHPTQKTIHLLKFLIDTFTSPNDVVIDPCAGSGVTLLAAEQMGRKSYGFEIKKEFIKSFEKELKPMAGEKEFIFTEKEVKQKILIE